MVQDSDRRLMGKRETDWFRGMAAVMVVLSHYVVDVVCTNGRKCGDGPAGIQQAGSIWGGYFLPVFGICAGEVAGTGTDAPAVHMETD